MKERLIGAAVLVALGVWLIPWVLDGPEEQIESRSAALQLPIPEEPVPMRSQTIRLGEEQDPPAASTSTLPAPAEEPVESAAEHPEPAVAAAPTALPPAASTAVLPAASTAVPPAAEEAVEDDKAAPAPASSQPVAEHVADAKPAQPAPAAASTPRSAQGGWVVQLGSFSEEENARRLAQRVATFGYSPDISNHRTSGRTMYRVRVGPHDSRARADAAASALSAHGFVAQVVTAD